MFFASFCFVSRLFHFRCPLLRNNQGFQDWPRHHFRTLLRSQEVRPSVPFPLFTSFFSFGYLFPSQFWGLLNSNKYKRFPKLLANSGAKSWSWRFLRWKENAQGVTKRVVLPDNPCILSMRMEGPILLFFLSPSPSWFCLLLQPSPFLLILQQHFEILWESTNLQPRNQSTSTLQTKNHSVLITKQNISPPYSQRKTPSASLHRSPGSPVPRCWRPYPADQPGRSSCKCQSTPVALPARNSRQKDSIFSKKKKKAGTVLKEVPFWGERVGFTFLVRCFGRFWCLLGWFYLVLSFFSFFSRKKTPPGHFFMSSHTIEYHLGTSLHFKEFTCLTSQTGSWEPKEVQTLLIYLKPARSNSPNSPCSPSLSKNLANKKTAAPKHQKERGLKTTTVQLLKKRRNWKPRKQKKRSVDRSS